MKKLLIVLLVVAVCVLLCACGSTSEPTDDAVDNTTTTEEVTEASKDVKKIDFAVDNGSIKYLGFEEANAKLVSDDKDYVIVKFEFINNQDAPSQCQSVFSINFFQNGVQANSTPTYSSEGGDQYELVGNYFSQAMKGGKLTFARIVENKDNSPITVMVSEKLNSDNYQMMEIKLDKKDNDSEDKVKEDATKEEVTEEKTTESAVSKIWSSNYYVDEFDEPTDEWYIANDVIFSGTFSNSATTDSKLTAYILVDCNGDIAFMLYEYGRNQVKNSSQNYVDEYTITMRTADGKDHNVKGTLYCGGDRIFIDDSYINTVLSALKSGEKVMFRIVNAERNVESYLLKIDTGNFAEVYKKVTKG